MADYDRRPRGRGHRGGGFNDRKRRYRDDDFDDRRPQRRRYEEPLSVTLRRQILSIAESPIRRTEDDVATIAKIIAENYFDSDLTTTFLDLAVQMTVEQPLKIPFVAAVVILTNTQKPEFTLEVLKKIGDTLQKHLDSGSWREVKLCLRFLGSLQGLYHGEGVFPVLEDLFARAVELQTESSEDSLGLELVKVILLTIPYTMVSSAAGFEGHASALLEKTDIIASTPHALEMMVDPYPGLGMGDPTRSQSALALLQKHMQEESKNSWELACLPRPWKVKREPEDDDPLITAQKHPFPDIKVPEKVLMGPRPIFPEMYFSVYTEQDIETVPPTADVAALLIRDTLTDTINILDYNRNSTARFLIDLDCYFAPNTFVKRATAFDKLREAAGDRSTWKPEDVVVDAAFAQLFQLPLPEHKCVYYHSVLTEACKIAPAAIAPSLGRAIRFLYRNVDKMDLELQHRFLDWFAHHLSNFGFTWKWTEWVDDVALPDVNPKKAFIISALEKEIRLSFAQRIKGTLPEPYQALISDAKALDAPDFKFNEESTPFAAQGREIAQMIRKKANDEEMKAVLDTIEQEATALGMLDGTLPAIDAFVTAVCWVGSKSLSHVLSCIERSKGRLTAMAESGANGRNQIITSVLAYWRDQMGVGVNIVDKLLNYSIVSPASVVEWALVDRPESHGARLAAEWTYELVAGTCAKVAGRVRLIVHAMRRPGLPEDQIAVLREALDREADEMKALFASVDRALAAVDAAQDGMMQAAGSNEQLEQAQLVKGWVVRWRRTFQRRIAVEDIWVREELAKPIPEPEPEPMQAVTKELGQDSKANSRGLENGNVNTHENERSYKNGAREQLDVDEEMATIS